ncbi:glycosyltransferase family 4 protein [Sphingomonas sp. CJ20]
MTRPGKLAFVARRYHSNQAPLIAELARLGWEIAFFAEYVGRSEDHSTVTPEIIGHPRAIVPPFDRRQTRFAVYSPGAMRRIVAARPDVAILRDFSIATLLLAWRLRAAGTRVVLYTQQPYRVSHYGWPQALYHRLFARDVVTPTDGYTAPGEPALPLRKRSGGWAPTWHFLPFVALPAGRSAMPVRDESAPIRILTVGKFTPRKKLLEWIALAGALTDEGLRITLTIAGAPLDAGTLAAAQQALAQLPGGRLLVDYPHAAMPALYAEHDLFVLPSVAEPASVSQLEAMAHGVPVICSSDNGTACYVDHGRSGYVFDARNWETSLADCVRRAASAIASGQSPGDRGREAVARSHTVTPWHDLLRSILPRPRNSRR